MLHSRSTACCLLAATAGLVLMSTSSRAQPLLTETFDDDPITNGRATAVGDTIPSRFTTSPGTLTAQYDTLVPTTKLLWTLPGSQTLSETDSFSYTTSFTIDSLAAEFGEFAQIAFGLINSTTTGADRAGGSGAGGYAHDLVTFDYFPNVSNFSAQTVASTVTETDVGQGYLAQFDANWNIISPGAIVFPFGAESELDTEQPLAVGTPLTAVVTYLAADRTVTLQVSDAGGLLDINLTGEGGPGGSDGDVTTVQTTLRAASTFTVDAFALTLWEDTFIQNPSIPSVLAAVTFDQFSVHQIPEPTGIGVLAIMGAAALHRRRRTARMSIARSSE